MLVKLFYGRFFPRDLVTSHFINLYLTMVVQYLESTLHTLDFATWTNLRQAFRLSGTTFVKMVCIQLVNPSILFKGKFSKRGKICHYCIDFDFSRKSMQVCDACILK